jgi:hypothetical protein
LSLPHLQSMNPKFLSAALLVFLSSCLSFQSEFVVDLRGRPDSLARVVKLDLKIGDHSGSCNGFMFEPSSRAVLTAAHCVIDASWVGVRRSSVVNGRLLVSYQLDRYEVVNLDRYGDTAILLPFRATNEPIDPRALPGETPHQGEAVYFYDRDLELRRGTLLNSGLLNTDFSEGLRVWVIEHQTHKGDSGSPVFNESGRLVGLIVAGNFEQQLTFIIPLENLFP